MKTLIKKFNEDFNQNYEYIYDNNLEGKYKKALDYFDNVYLPKTKDESTPEFKMLKEFNTYRRDFISSDREAMAYIQTLFDYDLLEKGEF